MIDGPLGRILALWPLALYLLRVGLWLRSRRPKVVGGTIDTLWLAFGCGGLLAFGPIARFIVPWAFPKPNLWAWLAWPSFLVFLLLLSLPRASRRLVLYNADRAIVDEALTDVLATAPIEFRQTIGGFEDIDGRRGLNVDPGRLGRTVAVEAVGPDPEILIGTIRRGLAQRLAARRVTPAASAVPWLILAVGIALVPWLLP